MQNGLNKNDWARKVFQRIESDPVNAENLRLAEEAARQDGPQGSFDTETVDAPLEPYAGPDWTRLRNLRGDEPDESLNRCTPEEYADFLTTEWDLYGPEGE